MTPSAREEKIKSMEFDIIVLLTNINKVHTTEMGYERIKKNLQLNTKDVVKWCKIKMLNKDSIIIKKGKNWYISFEDCIITVNATSYTIITAHKSKKK